jgi:hypothetical protein
VKTQIVPLAHEREARVSFGRTTPWGVNVSSILFDSDAQIVANTPTTTYFDYCDAEIVHHEIAAMFEAPNQDEISLALGDLSLECTCDLDDNPEGV